MQYVELIVITAVIQFLFFGVMTGKARVKYGVKAPATTGEEGFERMYRVQMNTLEMLVIFIPVIFIASNYWSPLLTSSLGLVYIIGRFIYWRAYVNEPKNRAIGFMLSLVPSMLLMVLSVVGIIISLFEGKI
jgi:uncharacterized MAPEG superfamily protein